MLVTDCFFLCGGNIVVAATQKRKSLSLSCCSCYDVVSCVTCFPHEREVMPWILICNSPHSNCLK